MDLWIIGLMNEFGELLSVSDLRAIKIILPLAANANGIVSLSPGLDALAAYPGKNDTRNIWQP